MTTNPQPLAIVSARAPNRDTIHLSFARSESELQAVVENIENTHSIEFHPSPAAYLKSLERLSEQQQQAGRQAIADGIRVELDSIKCALETGDISRKESIQLAEGLIERLGGSDLTKIPLQVAAQDYVLGDGNRQLLQTVHEYTQHLTPSTANSFEDAHKIPDKSAFLQASLVKIDELRDIYALVKDPNRPELAETAHTSILRETILRETRNITDQLAGPDVTKIPLQVAAQDYVQGHISRTVLENFANDNSQAAALQPTSHAQGHSEERSIADDR